ncbi:hypothetical protein [Flavivirga eckloniae]|uniref:DUF3899 domain-containing protein n=1 Tax=Flavivirga eckloniae TaxID=1803846 RepID=A0A2K9PUG7_9FLAO|nr:hypothetical protein [Flavivirga eckloniae]AUP80187.1 hypothetical protein C1H87_16310 [Flavivirga eckloniae]
MEFLGAFLFYFGLLATIIAIFKLMFNYSSKIGIKASRKVYKDESHETQDENEAMVNKWIKSNLLSIVYRIIITIIGLVLLLIYGPNLLPW